MVKKKDDVLAQLLESSGVPLKKISATKNFLCDAFRKIMEHVREEDKKQDH